MEISIIIVNWRSAEYLEQCLRGLYSKPPNAEYEIVVIDSASYDGCERMLGERFPEVKFMQATSNLGFAKANNVAFKRTTGEAVLFLNPDTELSGCEIDDLLCALKTSREAGAVGPKLLNTDGSVQSSCIQAFPTILNQLFDSELLRVWRPDALFWGTAPLHAAHGPAPVDAISGACLMVKREVFIRAGMFSEDYFMYSEDIDLSYAIGRLGLKCYYVPSVRVVHHGGGSSQQAVTQFAAVMTKEATYKFLGKTRGYWYGKAFRATTAVAAVARISVLAVLWPVQRVRGKGEVWRGALRKWMWIFAWCARREWTLARFA